MSDNTPKKIAQMWVEAYNSHTTDAIVDLYDDNIVNLQLPWDKTAKGRDALRTTYTNIFQSFPDITIEIDNLIENDQWVAIEWIFSGTMKGQFAGHAPNNNSFKMRGCEIFKVIKGKIIVQHGYWDKATMFQQLKLDL